MSVVSDRNHEPEDMLPAERLVKRDPSPINLLAEILPVAEIPTALVNPLAIILLAVRSAVAVILPVTETLPLAVNNPEAFKVAVEIAPEFVKLAASKVPEIERVDPGARPRVVPESKVSTPAV